MTEVLPTTPWNFGLDVSQGLAFRELPWTYDSPYGMIESEWKYDAAGKWTWTFVVPPH